MAFPYYSIYEPTKPNPNLQTSLLYKPVIPSLISHPTLHLLTSSHAYLLTDATPTSSLTPPPPPKHRCDLVEQSKAEVADGLLLPLGEGGLEGDLATLQHTQGDRYQDNITTEDL